MHGERDAHTFMSVWLKHEAIQRIAVLLRISLSLLPQLARMADNPFSHPLASISGPPEPPVRRGAADPGAPHTPVVHDPLFSPAAARQASGATTTVPDTAAVPPSGHAPFQWPQQPRQGSTPLPPPASSPLPPPASSPPAQSVADHVAEFMRSSKAQPRELVLVEEHSLNTLRMLCANQQWVDAVAVADRLLAVTDTSGGLSDDAAELTVRAHGQVQCAPRSRVTVAHVRSTGCWWR